MVPKEREADLWSGPVLGRSWSQCLRKSSSCLLELCDSGQISYLSEPQFPHLKKHLIKEAFHGVLVKFKCDYACQGLNIAPGIQKDLKKRELILLSNPYNAL